ncbi:MAG: XdhC family protein [Opitutaceae bacterium]
MIGSEFWQCARDALAEGQSVYVCLVVEQSKGSPGTSAARLLITEDGEQYGTIGGGVMERRIMDDALDALDAGRSIVPSLREMRHRADGSDEASGLICGGAQTNLEWLVRPEDGLFLFELICAAAHEETGCLHFTAEGLKLVDQRNAPEGGVVLARRSKDDWDVWMPLANQRRIVVYGGGHCGVALANAMYRLDYAVSVVEPRGDLTTLEELDFSIPVIADSFAEAAVAIEQPEDTIAIVMTYSMATDIQSLAGLLSAKFKWIGLMGSQVKIAHIRRDLLSMGISELQISKIIAPVGLDFNSDTPEEIAVSISAQILLKRGAEESL